MKLVKLNNNQLKIIAMIAMVCDHVGKEVFPQYVFLQIIGRLALPIFSYMIAEGCNYTKNRKSYLLKIAALGIGCQAIYFIAEKSMYQNILITFSLSIITIYVLDILLRKKSFLSGLSAVLVITAILFICTIMPKLLSSYGFNIDYGVFGVILPVVVYFCKNTSLKLLGISTCIVGISFDLGGIQWFSLLSIPFIALYNGKRGKLNLKYLFYIFYPAHLAIIYLIKLAIDYL